MTPCSFQANGHINTPADAVRPGVLITLRWKTGERLVVKVVRSIDGKVEWRPATLRYRAWTWLRGWWPT